MFFYNAHLYTLKHGRQDRGKNDFPEKFLNPFSFLFFMKYVILLLLVLLAGCAPVEVNDFESCVSAGYPVLESYPRQCIAADQTYTEVIEMPLQEAMDIAADECGNLTDEAFFNENTNTWWIDMDLEKEGCNPACVVSTVTRTAEINWRCTGLIPG